MGLIETHLTAIETLLFSGLATLLAAKLAARVFKAEFRRKKCVFCGESISADEHAHHLEICGLMKLLDRRTLASDCDHELKQFIMPRNGN